MHMYIKYRTHTQQNQLNKNTLQYESSKLMGQRQSWEKQAV